MNKILVIFAVENVLSNIGKPVLEQVCTKLYSKYHCLITDCYEHPEYLNSVLKDLFGDSYKEIIKSIKQNLEDFEEQKFVKNFLTKLQG